jgi:hypothetical protein
MDNPDNPLFVDLVQLVVVSLDSLQMTVDGRLAVS